MSRAWRATSSLVALTTRSRSSGAATTSGGTRSVLASTSMLAGVAITALALSTPSNRCTCVEISIKDTESRYIPGTTAWASASVTPHST